jgi:hypothetical protein
MRLRSIPFLVLIIAVVAGLGAWTDRPTVKVTNAPAVIKAAKPWYAIIEVSRRGRPLDGFKPVLTLQGPRGIEKVRATELGGGRYRVRLRMPHGGFYAYTLVVGERVAARGTVYSIPK